MRRADAALGAALLLVSGCSLAPDYHRPEVAVPAAYKELPPGWATAAPAAAADQRWWGAFNDPVLDGLEARIEGGNQSLAASIARFDQARAALREARADFYPTIGAGGSAERDHAGRNVPSNTTGHSATGNDYEVGASLSWEIDLFGRVRNSVRAAGAEAAASAADVAGVRLGLQTQLANSYFQMRGLDAREGLLRQTVDAYQRAYDLTNVRHEGGIASGLDTSRARTQLSSAKAELAGIRAQRAAYEHAIAVLVGEPASSFAIPSDPRQSAVPVFPTELPSTLLQRRPDIDAAERRVFAANARIGVARAALYPSLSLGGQGGFETRGPNLLSAASSFWALGPASLAMTLFDGGARVARVRQARAEFTEASANYKQTVLQAFREVEDDIASARDLTTQEANQRDAASAAARTQDLATIRYRDGASDYLEVVTAQTAALDTERTLLDLRTQRLATAVDSVRALGGTDVAKPAG